MSHSSSSTPSPSSNLPSTTVAEPTAAEVRVVEASRQACHQLKASSSDAAAALALLLDARVSTEAVKILMQRANDGNPYFQGWADLDSIMGSLNRLIGQQVV